ncbi:Txe/YoeB family addiction module toxin [Enorma sp.]|uniref:Txe/YoeB family addiction module toxin n=1 Tax=Enorma sp. TaxID=1920692 RepID=UPI0025B9DB7E|nr:Txe/YoeB family addiction module toxin [Enorma sp.]
MRKAWTDDAWDDCLWWRLHDRKMLKRINQLIRDVERDPFNGIGKPEPLRGELSRMWSRHINHEDRLVYEIMDGRLIIYSAKDHYA